MRFKFPAIVAAILFASSGPLGATDYSDMAKPSYARLHLITAKQMQQTECAGLAVHLGQTRPGFGKKIGTLISQEVTRRLTADLGDQETAAWFVEGKASNHSSPVYDDALKADIIRILEGQCGPLFEKAAKGSAELEAALGPVPSKPLDLPDPGQCLGVLTYATERKVLDVDDMKGLMQEFWIDEAPKAEQATRKAKLQTGVSMLRSVAPSEDQLYGMFAACVPTMRDVMAAQFQHHPGRKYR